MVELESRDSKSVLKVTHIPEHAEVCVLGPDVWVRTEFSVTDDEGNEHVRTGVTDSRAWRNIPRKNVFNLNGYVAATEETAPEIVAQRRADRKAQLEQELKELQEREAHERVSSDPNLVNPQLSAPLQSMQESKPGELGHTPQPLDGNTYDISPKSDN